MFFLGVTIDLPPLRSRGDDILLLSYHFLKQFATELGKDIVHIDSGAQKLLKSYPFPGNIRELRNLMERAVILCESDQLSSRDFAELATTSPGEITGGDDEAPFDLAELEERAIRRALAKADSNQTEAARYLGIGHDALRYRLKKYNISCD